MDLLHKYNISLVVGSIEHPEREIIAEDDQSAAAIAVGMSKFRREPVALVVRDASSLPDAIRDYPIVVLSDSIPDASPVFPAVLDRAVMCPLNHNGPFVYREEQYDPGHGILARAFMEASLRPVIVLGRLHHDPRSIIASVLSRSIPIVATESALDLVPSTHNLFIGRLGVDGDRAGNFAVQNADLVIIFGVIDDHPFFAREAHVIRVGGRSSGPCHAHVPSLPEYAPRARRDWIDKCREWKQKWTNELPLDSGFSPYLFFSLFYQSFSRPKIVVAHMDPKGWYHPVYHQNLIGDGDRFLLSPTGDVLSFVSCITTDLPVFVVFEPGRFFSMSELDGIRGRNICILCMRLDTEETTLSHEQYSSRTPADRAWYLDEVGEAIGVPYVSLDSSTFSDILDLNGVAGPYLIDVFFTGDFTPSPFGRPDLPLEEMIPRLHDHASEMLIAPVNP